MLITHTSNTYKALGANSQLPASPAQRVTGHVRPFSPWGPGARRVAWLPRSQARARVGKQPRGGLGGLNFSTAPGPAGGGRGLGIPPLPLPHPGRARARAGGGRRPAAGVGEGLLSAVGAASGTWMANKILAPHLGASPVSVSPSRRRGKQFREGRAPTRVTQRFQGLIREAVAVPAQEEGGSRRGGSLTGLAAALCKAAGGQLLRDLVEF